MSDLPIPAPSGIGTFVELLRWRAAVLPEQCALRFLADGETESARLTYGDIDRQARIIAVRLGELARPANGCCWYIHPARDFVSAFFGCLYAGAIAVPVYPPPAHRPAPRLESTVASARPAFALTTAKIRAKAPKYDGVQWLVADEFPADAAAAWRNPGVGPRDIAFLQYTSGSTASPRGVMLTHANLLHNSAVIAQGFDHPHDGRGLGVFWLPLYHDMGLIGGVLQPIYAGGPTVLMPPVTFLTNPYRWLKTISDLRATTSGGPNFAYEYCAAKSPMPKRRR